MPTPPQSLRTSPDFDLLRDLPLHYADHFGERADAQASPMRFRLKWIESASGWHGGGPEEVFVVLEGEVDMHYRDLRQDRHMRLRAGDVFSFDGGREFVACPQGRARVLMVERGESRPGQAF